MVPFYGLQIHIALAFWTSGSGAIAYDVSNLVALPKQFKVSMHAEFYAGHSEFRIGSSNSATAAVRLLVQCSATALR